MTWKTFEAALDFGAADPDNPAPLVEAVDKAKKANGGSPRLLHHLAIPPVASAAGHGDARHDGAEQRRARDHREAVRHGPRLCSRSERDRARGLRQVLHFRIDHFLGKEAVDDILAFRFANGLFEPIWNRNHVSYVQIDVPETLSIEGRAAFYDKTGAYRDMVVTHLLQVLGFVAMEPPTSLDAKPLRDPRRSKVFEAIQPLDLRHVVHGRYRGYRNEPGVSEALANRDVRGAEGRRRQLALARRALLPEDGQELGAEQAGHHDGVPRSRV